MEIFFLRKLPIEIIHHIAEYDGRVKRRNGKYICQLDKNDSRYNVLLDIPPICSISSEYFTYHYMVYLDNNNINDRSLHVIYNGEQIKMFYDAQYKGVYNYCKIIYDISHNHTQHSS